MNDASMPMPMPMPMPIPVPVPVPVPVSVSVSVSVSGHRPSFEWRWRHFDELGVHELQGIYMARQQVFVIEQACAFADADGCDALCSHLAAWSTESPAMPIAYARVVQPGVKYSEPSIGRVLTLPVVRGTGFGRLLMAHAIARCTALHPGQGIRISAQSRLERFYATLGFSPAAEPYLEDGILHTEMLKPAAPG